MTKTIPKVNVFIASYNRQHLLPLSIDSVLNQTYPNYHIYIIDDYSQDGAQNIAKSYELKYPNKISVICKDRNLGVCDSVNRILEIFEEKRREYFAFFSNDDIWLPQKLELQMQCFENDNELGMVFSEAKIIDDEGQLTGTTFSDLCTYYQGSDVTRQIFLEGNFICGPSTLVSYNALSSLGWIIPDCVGTMTDMYMWLIISSQYKVKYEKSSLLYYRISSDGIS
ncbi:MAG: glycosyltransferase, partial [Desulfomonilia bacterium]